jgi:hypothetical protein
MRVAATPGITKATGFNEAASNVGGVKSGA